MLGNRSSGKKGGNASKLSPWPFDEFQKSWLVMGGNLDKFHSSSMYDFQLLRSAYCITQGIDENEQPEETTETLDALYASIKPIKSKL